MEFASTVPYAIGTAKLVASLVDRDAPRAARWALVASAGFLAPDVFTLATTDRAPRWLIVVITTWLAGAAIFAIVRVRQAVRERSARHRRV